MKNLAFMALLGLILASGNQPQVVGNPEDVQTATTPGVVLMGGAGEVKESLEWMVKKCNGGDFLVLSTRPSTIDMEIFALGGVDSVETLIINSRVLANSPEIVAKIKNAEAIFIPGGDQDEYVRYWKGTETAAALNEVRKKIPIGGTSAGMAIMGEYYYAPKVNNNPATTQRNFSLECLADPFHQYVSGLGTNFIKIPILQNLITDSHYSERNRHGRHMTFMARLILNFQLSAEKVRGIGVDENTALCIEENGKATVMGKGKAYFLHGCGSPEVCEERRPLTWDQKEKAVKVYSVPKEGDFNLKEWTGVGGTWMYWYVQDGELHSKQIS